MENTKNTAKENEKLSVPDITGVSPKEKWENLKKYIITQIERIDEETEWQNTEPEWWLEMQNIERNIKQ